MMEIDISLLDNVDCSLLSGSQAELGPNAAGITWTNCLKLASAHPLVTDTNRHEICEHFAAYGAWDDAEIEAWDDTELSAMVWQEGAAGMRELDEHGVEDGRVYVASEGSRGRRLFLYLGV